MVRSDVSSHLHEIISRLIRPLVHLAHALTILTINRAAASRDALHAAVRQAQPLHGATMVLACSKGNNRNHTVFVEVARHTCANRSLSRLQTNPSVRMPELGQLMDSTIIFCLPRMSSLVPRAFLSIWRVNCTREHAMRLDHI